MVDPISWTLLGSAALTEAVKFLYGQAAELIKLRRGDKADKKSAPVVPPTGIFVENIRLEKVDEAQLTKLEQSIREARLGLSEYADGLLPIDGRDTAMVDQLSRLRDLLEEVYGRSLTFVGEERRASTRLQSKLSIDTVKGKATAMRIGEASGICATTQGQIGSIDAGGEYVGLEIDKAGK